MRKFFDTWLREVVFWAFVLTALPACDLIFQLDPIPPDANTPDPGFNLVRGTEPRDGLLLCDIEIARQCATASEIGRGIRLTDAAVALNEGRTSDIGLDYSPAALLRCNNGPEAVKFLGPFPQGQPVCLNCGEVLGDGKANPNAEFVCQVACWDMFLGDANAEGTRLPVNPPTLETIAYCTNAARVSTNALFNSCYAGGCESAGTPAPFFADPRIPKEAVIWRDLLGVAAGGPEGNTLTRTAPFTGNFDAGAVSEQFLSRGEGFVEFGVSRNQQLGLTSVAAGCLPSTCPDTDPGIGGINFAMDFGGDSRVYIFENGVKINGPDLNGSFGVYVPGERFRIYVAHRPDNGRAEVQYARLNNSCLDGAVCVPTFLYTSTKPVAYALRIDTSLQEEGTSFSDVRIVYIKP